MINTKNFIYKPKIVSIFSGCGGLDYGFHMEGYETIWANDFAEWACKSFAANFGDVIHYNPPCPPGTPRNENCLDFSLHFLYS